MGSSFSVLVGNLSRWTQLAIRYRSPLPSPFLECPLGYILGEARLKAPRIGGFGGKICEVKPFFMSYKKLSSPTYATSEFIQPN